MKASIVVPVYNAATYLEDTLRSILQQTEPDFELICVDDGSTDGSAVLLERAAAADARVRVLRGGHAGVSHARNVGVTAALGRYVFFADADDLMRENLLEVALDVAEKQAADMTIFGFAEYFGCEGTAVDREVCSDEALYGGAFEALECAEPAYSYLTPNVWRIAFRREFLQACGVQFHEDLNAAEDLAFIYELLFCGARVALVPDRLYLYRRDVAASLTRSGRGDSGLRALAYIKQAELECARPEALYQLINVALDTIEYSARNAFDLPEFMMLYTRFVGEWLPLIQENKQLVNPRFDGFLSKLETMTAEEYLFFLFEDSKAEVERLKCQVADAWGAHDVARAECEQARLECEQAQAEVAAVKGSNSYKIGNKLLVIPAAIKHRKYSG